MILLIAGSLLPAPARAQDKTTRRATVQQLLTAQRYVFRARFMQPMSGPQRYLTAGYTVSVTPDSVVCYLPYAGVAYTAPVDPSRGGIKFTSVKFTYSSRLKKNGVREVTIRPADVRDVQQLYLSVAPDGSAQLQAVRVSAQPVNFTGDVEPPAATGLTGD